MAGRGSQTFQKRQKELARKEKQEEKRAKRLQRKNAPAGDAEPVDDEGTASNDSEAEPAPALPGLPTFE